MAGQVYFGNGTYQTWIDAPQSGMKAGSSGYVNSQLALNGRAFIKRSRASHREFNASWIGSLNSSLSNLQIIKDFADGLYGSGPFYWLDPYAIDQNLMPPHWASPTIASSDWPYLHQSITPTFTTTYATYSFINSVTPESTRKLTIIIPNGYKLNFGWHSNVANITAATTAGIKIIPYLRSNGSASTTQNPYSILYGTSTRVSTDTTAGYMAQYDGGTYSKVEIYIGANGTNSVNICSMAAQITPTSDTVQTGSFISGKGTTALEFASFPEIEYYSSKINGGQVGMSVNFIEVDN